MFLSVPLSHQAPGFLCLHREPNTILALQNPSCRRPHSRDHLHSQHRGSSPHKPCSPRARANSTSQARKFPPGGGQKLLVRLLSSPAKGGFASLFCSVILCTHTPEEVHKLLFPGFHHRKNCQSLSSGRDPVVFTQLSKEPSSTRTQTLQPLQSCQEWVSLLLVGAVQHSQEPCCGHTGLMLQSKDSDSRITLHRGTAASERHPPLIRLKIQGSSQIAFLLPPSAAALLCCGSMDPALRNSFQLIHLFHLL